MAELSSTAQAAQDPNAMLNFGQIKFEDVQVHSPPPARPLATALVRVE